MRFALICILINLFQGPITIPGMTKNIEMPMVLPSFIQQNGKYEGKTTLMTKKGNVIEEIGALHRTFDMIAD